MRPEEFAGRLRAERGAAILRTSDTGRARSAMEAAVRGGFRVVEFTLSIPQALNLVSEFSRRPELVVGAGTVLSVEEARAAAAAGAQFIVSPIVDEAVVAAAREAGLASMPGTFTPTEMMRAHRAGAALVKLFPQPGAGPTYVRQILGPLPMLRIVPTSGVDASNAAAYLEAGAWAVGFVGSLFDPGEVLEGRVEAIEERARKLLAAARAAKI
jgi:Entner-Doudoroff aldolase